MTTPTDRPAAVLDASALLAVLLEEPGRGKVTAAIARGAVIGAVNYAEVLTRLGEGPRSAQAREARLRRIFEPFFKVEPYLEEDAVRAAALRTLSKRQGLSLGDRSCLALAARLGAAVLTADRAWVEVPGLAIPITLIR